MDPKLIEALTSHAPALVVGAVLCLLVLAAKLPAFAVQWQRLPVWARPLVPVVLALVSGIGESLVQGQVWWLAVLVQVGAALPAIGYALPSPTAHLEQVILPDTPVVRQLAGVDGKATIQPLDRDTTPGAAPGAAP